MDASDVVTTVVEIGTTAESDTKPPAQTQHPGLEIERVHSVEQVLDRVRNSDPDVLLAGGPLSEMDSPDLVRAVRLLDERLPIVVAEADQERARAARAAGADEVIASPGESGEIIASLEEVVTGDSGDPEELESERRYRELVQSSPAPINIFDKEGTILYSNQATADLLGVDSPSELSGRSIFDFIDTEYTDIAEGELAQVIAAEEAVGPTQMRIVSEDGDERYIQVSTAPGEFRGEPVGQAVVIDVTPLRETEHDLRAERQFVQDALDALDDIFFVTDFDGELRRWNAALSEVSGYSTSELDEKPLPELVSGEDESRISEAAVTALEEGTAMTEATLVSRSGRGIPLEVSFQQITDTEGNLIGVAGIGRDISDRRQRTQELKNQREQLSVLTQTNRLVRDINAELIRAKNRREIERVVCEQLAEAGPYELAWIGNFDREGERFVPRTVAGEEKGFLDTLVSGSDEYTTREPMERALRTGEVQSSSVSDPVFDRWQDAAEAYGFSTVTAIPISYQSATYGILTLYSGTSSGREALKKDVLRELGESIGAAINSTQRKQALHPSPGTELRIRITDSTEFFVRFATELNSKVTLARSTPQPDGTYSLQVSVADPERLPRVCNQFISIDTWTRFDDGDEDISVELQVTDVGLVEWLADHGSTLIGLTAYPEYCEITAATPPETDSRTFVDQLKLSFNGVDLLAKEAAVNRLGPSSWDAITNALTNRQYEALTTAYNEGYYETPRRKSGAEIADMMGISAPTFGNHLRNAHRCILEEILGSQSDTSDESVDDR
ncbi:PAS domain S-box protein [Halomicroarcula sp. F13]|uniref:PAS domain S-box protein n=1 Tax=Haloarcula rubra TaxID=2487747 RepID=A0AAW4PPD9_9EURY|nr:PAS domain S-box protein [Halomicroarcula rubra]MBX0323016.1 PAS domain S-box protein [Halomicroarcula rubra]